MEAPVLIIAENINIMSKTIGEAIRNREKKPVQELAEKLAQAGCEALDLNAGPARKDGPELMEWLVGTVQEVTELPLSLDTSNIEAIEAGLGVYRDRGGAPLINSISVRPERIDALLPLAVERGARVVALMLGVEGIPRDANERGMLLAEFLHRAAQAGLAEENIYVDPIVLPISSQQDQLLACTEFMSMLSELAPGVSSTCGVSNVSNGVDNDLRPILNRTYTAMLMKHGLKSAIVNGLDPVTVDIMSGRRPDIVTLVHGVMDGSAVDETSLSAEERDYVKTTRVLLGKTIFSESWLQI
jgi:5-methyltetrahydrofolate corrinoid/iron sulfur protein methyltransferase